MRRPPRDLASRSTSAAGHSLLPGWRGCSQAGGAPNGPPCAPRDTYYKCLAHLVLFPETTPVWCWHHTWCGVVLARIGGRPSLPSSAAAPSTAQVFVLQHGRRQQQGFMPQRRRHVGQDIVATDLAHGEALLAVCLAAAAAVLAATDIAANFEAAAATADAVAPDKDDGRRGVQPYPCMCCRQTGHTALACPQHAATAIDGPAVMDPWGAFVERAVDEQKMFFTAGRRIALHVMLTLRHNLATLHSERVPC
eukprot:361114-Chlamydomonas_euryale.AAC.7